MSAVTNLLYIPDTPFGPGNDWTLIVVCPPTGSGQVSFNGGSTWISSSTYNTTYHGFELKCQDGAGTQWGQGDCSPIMGTGFGVVRARKQGESDFKLFTLGQGEQNVGGDGYAYAYSAFCNGPNIFVSFAVQYATTGPNNYQLDSAKTERITLSINGINIAPLEPYSDGCLALTCHWTLPFAAQSIPIGNFPLNLVFGDSTGTVASWSTTVSAGNIGDPCFSTTVPTPTPVAGPTASAVSDNFTAYSGVQKTLNVAANDTACSSGSTTYVLLTPAVNGSATLSSSGSLVYTSGANFVGVDSMDYGIFCAGVLRSRARVKITVTSNNPCYGQSICPEWVNTGVTECNNGLESTRFMNVNPCAVITDQFEWRITGKCRKKVPCPPDAPCH